MSEKEEKERKKEKGKEAKKEEFLQFTVGCGVMG